MEFCDSSSAFIVLSRRCANTLKTLAYSLKLLPVWQFQIIFIPQMKHLLHREIYIKVALCSVIEGVPPHHFNVYAINEMFF